VAEERLRVAVFGGSFNPPHVAHLFAVVHALACAPIDRVLVVPVYRHPFAKELATYDERLAMCRLALGRVPGVEISTVERELEGESLTLRTVEHLAATRPEWSLRLLVGADVLADLPKWHRFDRIAEIAPPLVLGRKGFGDQGSGLVAGRQLLPEISSTEVRKAIAEGRAAELEAEVPRAVLDYIAARGLYGAKVG
jgi:nicotinate-nucleotide adenylyltransferase